MSDWLHISEHDADMGIPALAVQVIEIGDDWKTGKLSTPATQAIRICADEDCLLVVSLDPKMDLLSAIRIFPDVPERFTVPRGRVVYFAVKGLPDEEA